MSTFPAEVQQVQLKFGRGFLLGNGPVTATLTITPVFPGTKTIVWSATKDPYLPFSQVVEATVDAEQTVSVPRVDQTGWLDDAGAAYTNWYYDITVVYKSGNDSLQIKKTVQPRSADVSTGIDIEAFVTGTPAAAQALLYLVKTVNGVGPDSTGNIQVSGSGGFPGAVDTSPGISFDAAPSSFPGPGAYVSQTLNSSGWPVQYATVLTIVLNINRTFQMVFDKESGRQWTRTATGSTGWTPLLESVNSGSVSNSQVFAKTSSGGLTGFAYSKNYADPDTVVLRTAGGQVLVNDPASDGTGDLHAVNLRSAAAIFPNGRLGNRSADVSTKDWNDQTLSGFYRGNNTLNSPDGSGSYFFVIVTGHSSDSWVQQIATEYAGVSGSVLPLRRTWKRLKQNGTWQPWTLLSDGSGAIDPLARQAADTTTKKAAYRMGGTHNTTNFGGAGQTSIRERTPGLQLPVKATRWRLHYRNYNSLTSSNAGSSPVTVLKAMVGRTAGPTSTSEYACAAALQQMPGASAAVQGVTEWVSDWHTPESVGITDTRQKFNVQLDLSFTANDYVGMTSSMFCAMIDTTATGTGVAAPTVADPGTIGGGASATSWYSYNYMVGEAWIEYEYVDATVPNMLFVGHSYVDAAQFNGTTGQLGQPSGFAQKFSRRHKAAVSVLALSTSKMTDWANGGTISNKFDVLPVSAGYNFDAVFVMLGGNDIVNETNTPTTATMISRFQSVVNAITTRYPGVPIFAATNVPFGAVGDTTYGSGGKAVTQAMLDAQAGFNAGLYDSIRGLAGVIDFEPVMRDASSPNRPLLALLGADRIHPNPRGYDKLADAITLD